MADRVGHVKTHVRFVKTGHVIDVAADVPRRPVERVKMNRANLRQRFGQKILLQPGRQTHFLVQPVHVKIHRLIPAIQEIDLLAQRGQFALELRHRVRCRMDGLV